MIHIILSWICLKSGMLMMLMMIEVMMWISLNYFLNSNKSAGGYKIRASQNMPFELIRPLIHNVTVQGTSLSGELEQLLLLV